MGKCNCFGCEKYSAISDAVRKKDIDTLAKVAKELGCRAINAELDVNYYKSILNGSWPQAIEILEEALDKAKERRQNENQRSFET
ncbi:hypothetical protein LCGC14_1374020 [marine sediment metagenome]|uniref:Uncharacterized protein n=1 Tax=marine sediment metagenome TaxID=412755 RepID=A0A0F9K4J7_9ZZZZ